MENIIRMLFGRNKTKREIDKNLLLRANIAQAIEALYFNRKSFFYPGNRDYYKLEKTFEIIKKNLIELLDKKPDMLIFDGDKFKHELFNQDMANNVIDFLNFLLYLPPPRLSFRLKRAAEIGKMIVPTLTFILNSLINYKLPDYWLDKIDDYSVEAAAIIEILKENSNNQKIKHLSSKLIKSFDVDKTKKLLYKRKIAEWLRLNLII